MTYDPNVLFTENEYIYRFKRNATVNNGTVSGDLVGYKYKNDVGLYDIDSTGRQKSTYYVNSYTIKDGYNQTVQGRNPTEAGVSGTEFPYYNADGTTNQVDITVTLNHVIKVGSIQVKKEIDDSITTETTPNKDKEYKFKVEYTELFGDLDNKYSETGSTWKTMDRVTYTLKEAGKDDQTLTTGYTEENNKGTFTLKKGQTAEIQGIPVGTVVRVSEVIEDDAEYEVKAITDGEGNEPTTTKVIDKPMFITSGIEENTTYSYIIKNGLAMQTASLVVNSKVTTTGVNSGIATELEKIFNNDVFGYKVQTNSKKVSTNSAKLPITSDFTRTKDGGTDTLQTADTGSGTKGNTGSTNKTLTTMDAYYKWTDTSGRATGSGVGVPVDNTYNVHLQYDQTATFDSQIALDKYSTEAGAKPVYVNVEQATKTYTNGANTGTGGTRLANIDNNRTVADLYTTTYNITGASSTNGTAAYPKNASQLSANENVVIEYTFTNAVKLGQIQISKTVADGSDANINPNGSYEFTLTYTKLFGKDVSETPAKGWEGTSSTGATIITDGTGKFSIKKGETVTFAGVPVQTDYKVTEVIPTGAKYTVKGATLTDKNSTDISNGHLARVENDAYTVTNSLVNVDDISKLTVDNTYSTVPVLYKYHNRVNVNGEVTSLQRSNEWTYFVKYVDGALSTFIDGSGNITDVAKTAIVVAMPTIDNVLATYSLGTDSSYDSNYTLKELTDAEKSKSPYYSTADTASNVGYKDSMKALADNGNFYNGNKVILATIDNATRTYPVTVKYYQATPYNSTTKVNPMAEASTGVPDTVSTYSANVAYNTVVPLNETITRLMLDDPTPTSNTSNGKYLFAYWEREVSYQSGNKVTTQWVPVSTNYQYSYKVVNPTNIRAVYRTTDGTNKRYYVGDSGLVEDGTFTPLDGGSTTAPSYSKVPKPHYTIFWKMAEGNTVKKYKNASGSYTIDESVATAALDEAVAQSSEQPLRNAGLYYTVDTEYKAEYVIPAGQEICLPANGYDAAATDKVVNPYVKQVGSTAQNRAVFDIVFGSAGSADSDTAITNVGYILFYGKGSNNYIDPTDEKVSETKLKAIVSAASTGTANLTDATKYPGSGKCRVAKYTAKTSGEVGTNEVRLTNKNRVDLIIDVINNADSRNKFYTCYTYMIRREDDVDKVYVSDTPITFSPSEITLGSGGVTPTVETAYNLEIDNYYQDNDNANPDDTIGANKYTKANTYGYALSNAYTFADGKNLTFTIRPVQQGIYKGKLVKLMAGSNEITPITLVENGGQISYTFNKNHIPEADGNTLKLKAYFDPTLVGAKFTLTPTEGVEYKVYFDDVLNDTVNTTTRAKEIAVPFGTTVRVEAHTVLVNGKEGYAITDATKGSFTLVDDSTRKKSQMAVKEVAVINDMTSAALQSAIGTQPTANPLYYSVAVQQARGTYGATLNYTGANIITDSTETAKTTVLSHSASDSSATANILVWQGNPVITLSNTSGNYVLTAGTNTSVSGDTITVADTGAVVSIGGYAPLTLSHVANATTVVNVNGTDTTITTNDQVVNVPYNYDETTGTDVTVTVTSDTSNDYYIGVRNGYSNTSTSVASKTATLHSSITDLNSGLKPLPTTVKGYLLTVEAGTGGSVTIQWATTVDGNTISGETVSAADDPREYVLAQDSLLTMYATPASGYTFNNWNGNTSLTSTSVQVDQVGSSLSYTANFVATYTLSVTAGANGRVTVTKPDNSTVSVSAGDTRTFTVRSDATNKTFTLNAIAADNCHFVEWTGDLTSITATNQPITLDGNKSVTANFEANGITVTLDTVTYQNYWLDGNARIFIYYYNSSTDGWIQMTDSDGDGIYSALVPSGFSDIIFVRMKATGDPSFDNKWTQIPSSGGYSLDTSTNWQLKSYNEIVSI